MRKVFKSIYIVAALLLSSITNVSGQMVIQMENDGGVYKIPCEINGLRLKLIFDTGASSVCISESIALVMLENGYLEREDIIGGGSSIVADGRIVDNTHINIKSLKIGEVILNNIEAVVIHQQSAPLLLGQSAIQKLGTVSIDGNKLILNQYLSDSNDIAHIEHLYKCAGDAYANKYYELALPYFRELYNMGQLKSIISKSAYAECLIETKQTSQANDICHEMLIEVMSMKDLSDKLHWLCSLTFDFHRNKNYIECITTGQRYLVEAKYTNCNLDEWFFVVWATSESYHSLGQTDKGIQHIKNETQKYLQFVQLKPTDCWDNHSKNYYIGELYDILSTLYAFKNDKESMVKYLIIAAAWGNENAISLANENNVKYHQKPTKYRY